MPELPEVETIKEELNQLIVNKKIKSVEINLAKQVKCLPARFLKLVPGTKVKEVRRRAKVLIVSLNNGYYLVFHLKMTGQLIYRQHSSVPTSSGHLPSKRVGYYYAGGGHPIKHDLEDLPNKYSHVIFNFSDGSRLFFNDLRQFGWVKLLNEKELEKLEKEFGPEPLSINFSEFKKLFKNKKSVIKPLLMNPKFIAGVGNIYAQEALFCAGISPLRKAGTLKEMELEKLFECLKKILKLAIKMKGTSAENYVDAFGREGSMENYLKVYNRAGQACKRCKNKLKSVKQGSRATAYCKNCQK